jgi:hypothetical protein
MYPSLQTHLLLHRPLIGKHLKSRNRLLHIFCRKQLPTQALLSLIPHCNGSGVGVVVVEVVVVEVVVVEVVVVEVVVTRK